MNVYRETRESGLGALDLAPAPPVSSSCCWCDCWLRVFSSCLPDGMPIAVPANSRLTSAAVACARDSCPLGSCHCRKNSASRRKKGAGTQMRIARLGRKSFGPKLPESDDHSCDTGRSSGIASPSALNSLSSNPANVRSGSPPLPRLRASSSARAFMSCPAPPICSPAPAAPAAPGPCVPIAARIAARAPPPPPPPPAAARSPRAACCSSSSR